MAPKEWPPSDRIVQFVGLHPYILPLNMETLKSNQKVRVVKISSF